MSTIFPFEVGQATYYNLPFTALFFLIMKEFWKIASLNLPKLEMKGSRQVSYVPYVTDSIGQGGALTYAVLFVLQLTLGSSFIRSVL